MQQRQRQNNHNFSELSDSRRQVEMLFVNEFRLVLCLKSVVNVTTFDVIRLKSQLLWKCDQATYSELMDRSEYVGSTSVIRICMCWAFFLVMPCSGKVLMPTTGVV